MCQCLHSYLLHRHNNSFAPEGHGLSNTPRYIRPHIPWRGWRHWNWRHVKTTCYFSHRCIFRNIWEHFQSSCVTCADMKHAHCDFSCIIKWCYSLCALVHWRVYSQLPNLRGQAWASIGKSSSCMGHSADIVSLKEEVMRPKLESKLTVQDERDHKHHHDHQQTNEHFLLL